MYGLKDFVPPVAGKYRITSGEGHRASRRTTNGARMSSFHHGTDWAGENPGDKPDIRNITAGKVVWVGKAGGWGNTVIVENPDGYRVQYGHLDSIAVKVGDKVAAGGKIGVMGETGNVTGVHLDMIVTKDGKSIKRDGTVLATAPASIARRAGTGVNAQPSTQQPSAQTTSVSTAPTPTTTQSPLVSPPTQQPGTLTDLFANNPISLLVGNNGIIVPDTNTQNELFSEVSDMGLNSSLEGIYAMAAKAIADAKDSIVGKPMIQSANPIRAELSSIFDSIEV